MTPNYPFQTSNQLDSTIARSMEELNARLDAFGFTIWPFGADPERGIPMGFCTIGMTKVGVPEFYVSGMSPHSKEGMVLVDRFKTIYQYASQDSGHITPELLCRDVQQLQTEDPELGVYQWRPVNATRMLYGQCTMLRYWAESRDIIDLVGGVQIVQRDAEGKFPYESTPEQLLIDYVPFGVKTQTLEVK